MVFHTLLGYACSASHACIKSLSLISSTTRKEARNGGWEGRRLPILCFGAWFSAHRVFCIVISPSCANPGDRPSLPCLYSFTLRHIAGLVQCEAFADGLLPLSTHVFSGPVAPLVLVLINSSLSDLPQLFISHVSTCVRLLFNSSGKYQGAELAGRTASVS